MSKDGFLMNRWKAFGYALKGIYQFFKSENSAKVHLMAILLVIGSSFYFEISRAEWIYVLLVIGLVLVTEILNTALEELVDMVQPNHHPIAGRVKDFGAAAVLVSAIIAVIVAGIIFIPKVMEVLS